MIAHFWVLFNIAIQFGRLVLVQSTFDLKNSYIGCFQNVSSTKTGIIGSVEECSSLCTEESNNMLALKGGNECNCIDKLHSAVLSTRCNTSCSNSDACGGENFYSVYKGKPRMKHDSYYSYNKKQTEKRVFKTPANFTLEICAHFCLESNFTFFQKPNNDECGCFQEYDLIDVAVGKLICEPCENDKNESCYCYIEGKQSQVTYYSTRFQYEFQRGISTYSHCSDDFEVMTKCIKDCDKGWGGDSCMERDCRVNNGDCGSEMKCIESTVNNNTYVECVCPYGTVRNKWNACEIFRRNLALMKPIKQSSTYTYNDGRGTMHAKYATDADYIGYIIAHIFDSASCWITIDLEQSFVVGFVFVYNRICSESKIIERTKNFVVRLNETFDITAKDDVRSRLNLCGMWSGDTLQAGNPMRVYCEQFNITSKFVVVQQSDAHFEANESTFGLSEIEVYAAGCDIHNGRCGELKCLEEDVENITHIKCIKQSQNLTIDVPPIFKCFRRVTSEYQHEEYGLSYNQCAFVCESKSFRFTAVKSGIKCYCGNKLIVNDETSMVQCSLTHYDTYLVFDKCPEEKIICGLKISSFNINESYIGCFQYVKSTKLRTVASVKECSVICLNEINSMLALKKGKECHCISRLHSAVPSALCNLSCSNSDACGGDNFYSVYKGKSRVTHDSYFSYKDKQLEKRVFNTPDTFTLELCAHFCLESNFTFFQKPSLDKCSCFQEYGLISVNIGNLICESCEKYKNEKCYCYIKGRKSEVTYYSTRFEYEFQRGLSTYSHCSKNFEVISKCTKECSRGWKGESCMERDCTVNNGDCGSEMKCTVSTVNNKKYIECVCPPGMVRNKWNLCDFFRRNLAANKPVNMSSVYYSSVRGDHVGKYITDENYIGWYTAHVNDSKSCWIAIDLQKSIRVGFVDIYNRINGVSGVASRTNNFAVRLNETFDTTAEDDVRSRLNLCGVWPGNALQGGNPMRVYCENFTLISAFVVLQQSDQHFKDGTIAFALGEVEVYVVGCDILNGRCGELKCLEEIVEDMNTIKCIELNQSLTIDKPPIFKCFRKVTYEYELDELGLSYNHCSYLCKSKSYKFTAVKVGIKCYCGNKLIVNDETSVEECLLTYYNTYLVFDECPEKNKICGPKIPKFNISNSYIGCFQYVKSTENGTVASVEECSNLCKDENNNIIALKGGKECNCITRLHSAVVSTRCDTSCSNSDACGGKDFYSVYKGKIRIMHDGYVSYSKEEKRIRVLKTNGNFTLELCAHFCLESNLTFFQSSNDHQCSCFQEYGIIASTGGEVICDVLCKYDNYEICHCYIKTKKSDVTYFSTRFEYEFQRGISTYSHCSKNFEVIPKCIDECSKGWKGESCMERDCTVNNGDCGSEMKCTVSTVNNKDYVECACPWGMVRNKYDLCEIFRLNLAANKPVYTSSTYSNKDTGACAGKYVTDENYVGWYFAHLSDSKSCWITIDLQHSVIVGFVDVYNRISGSSDNLARTKNFAVRLNETFDTTAEDDIRSRLNSCGVWPGDSLQAGNPMRVYCENFTLISAFVVLQQSDQHFKDGAIAFALGEVEVYVVGCDILNGRCGELKCLEEIVEDMNTIKCIELNQILTIDKPPIFKCFRKVKPEYTHNEYGLSRKQCADICIFHSFKLAAMKAGIKCYCGNKLIVNDETLVDKCLLTLFDTYLVYDVDRDVTPVSVSTASTTKISPAIVSALTTVVGKAFPAVPIASTLPVAITKSVELTTPEDQNGVKVSPTASTLPVAITKSVELTTPEDQNWVRVSSTASTSPVAITKSVELTTPEYQNITKNTSSSSDGNNTSEDLSVLSSATKNMIWIFVVIGLMGASVALSVFTLKRKMAQKTNKEGVGDSGSVGDNESLESDESED